MDYKVFAKKVQAIIDANPTQPPTVEEYALIDTMHATLQSITMNEFNDSTGYRIEKNATSCDISPEEDVALEQSILIWKYHIIILKHSHKKVSFRLVNYIRAGYVYHHLFKLTKTPMSKIILCNGHIVQGSCYIKQGKACIEGYDDRRSYKYCTQLPYELAMMAYSCYVTPTHTLMLEKRLEALEAKQKETEEETHEEDLLGEGMDVGANTTVSLESYLQLQKEVERLTEVIRVKDEVIESFVD